MIAEREIPSRLGPWKTLPQANRHQLAVDKHGELSISSTPQHELVSAGTNEGSTSDRRRAHSAYQ